MVLTTGSGFLHHAGICENAALPQRKKAILSTELQMLVRNVLLLVDNYWKPPKDGSSCLLGIEVPAEGVCPAGGCLPRAAPVDVAAVAAALREPLRRAGSLAGREGAGFNFTNFALGGLGRLA